MKDTSRENITYNSLDSNLCFDDEAVDGSLHMGPPYSHPHLSSNMPLFTAVGLMLLCPFNFGLALGYSSPTLLQMAKDLGLEESTSALFASCLNVGALIGALLGGNVGERYGSRGGLLRTAPILLLGWSFIAMAQSSTLLIGGRLLVGLGIGISSVLSPLYIGEVSTVALRGALGSCNQLAITIGILAVYLEGMYLPWRSLASLSAVMGGLVFIAMSFAPDSPSWLVSCHDEVGAKRVLSRLRGTETAAILEYNELVNTLYKHDHAATAGGRSMYELLEPATISQTIAVVGCMILQQWSGINAIIFYSGGIFTDAGFGNHANSAALAVAAIQVPITLLSVFLMDRAGRVRLMQLAGIIMGISLLILSYFFHLVSNNQAEGWGIVAVMCLMTFISGFSIGWGPVPWVLVAEVFDSSINARAASVCVATSFLNGMATTFFFPSMRDTMGTQGVFFFYAVICLAGSLVFVTRKVPETKGLNEQQIARVFKNIK